MHRIGHIGIALLFYSPFTFALLDAGRYTLLAVGLVVMLKLAMIPDIDMDAPLIGHRTWTHTLWFAIGVAVGVAALGLGIQYGLDFFGIAAVVVPIVFLGGVGFLAVIAHLAADALNPTGVTALKGASDSRQSIGLFNSDSFWGNWGCLLLGFVANGVAVFLALQQAMIL
jgi:membrane-bound metal-dependent hydrolase YbcI (DUF457 family)